MKINLCCGPNMFPGWLNVDGADMEREYLRHLRDAPDGFVWPEPQRELAAWVKSGKPLDFMVHDVRKGLPWPDSSVDAIYIGQAIEHFNRRTEAPKLLKECLRVLKRGGAIKLTTPDLDQLVRTYLTCERGGMNEWATEQPAFYWGAHPADQLSYLMFGATGPDCTQEHYEGHFHLYTYHSLRELLHEVGFAHSAHDWPHKVRDCGMSHSFAIEAVKP
jgi:predicted SAM-dependent methyltransferase